MTSPQRAQRDLARRLEILADQRETSRVPTMLDGLRERRHEPDRKPGRMKARLVAVAMLASACTTEPQVDVQIEKGAVQVQPPAIDFTAPVTVVIEHCVG